MSDQSNKQKQEIEFELTNFNPNSIVDFSEWEKRQQQTLAENPFIEVTDRETWEIGKARRTALRTARTDLQKERDAVKKELNNAKTFVVNKYDEFINITTPAEEKQQETVKAFEDELEAERERKANAEQERADAIRQAIDDVEIDLENVIQVMTFDTIDESQETFTGITANVDVLELAEFGFLFNEMVERQNGRFTDRVIQLQEQREREIQELKTRQENKINELYFQANQAIDAITPDTMDSTRKKIDELFDIDFDFGEFKPKFESVAHQMFTKIDRTIEKMNQEREQRMAKEREQEMTAQRNRIVEIREGLLDLIFQITVDNHNEQKLDIQQKLEKPAKLFPELDSEWEKMAERVNQSFEQKFDFITQQIKQREFEKEQEQRAKVERLEQRVKQLTDEGLEPRENGERLVFDTGFSFETADVEKWTDDEFDGVLNDVKKIKAENRIHNQRWDTRKPEVEKMGFVYDEQEQKFIHSKFEMFGFPLEQVLNKDDEQWNGFIGHVADNIENQKKFDKAEKARQKKIAGDKEVVIGWIQNVITAFPSQNRDHELSTDEMKDLTEGIADSLSEWMTNQIEVVKNF